ncbi:peptidase S8 family protein, Pr1E [Metarhizium robertsii]|uniref:Peptidase S8, subtilisin, Asp-active site protein n=2 Tax=Metarhizium robertsii TaxID=568076 RepID=E9ETD2_METRA|nr:Peptidase S8, subtilisin, Asp-active site protein [Metarhizium robertsii ARSEF 23]EFZ00685.1 Peptidase S8, subtilisin, Asp-active site protein [Metarhizium robertsii ARSEF 23]EXV03193.1 peptidase S8 family protein, Pr1E [Metarhizium robertsii]
MHISITLALFFGLTSARVAHAPVVESQIDQPESVINDNTLAPLELALGLKNHVKLAKRSLQTQTSAPWGLRAISHRSPGDFYEEFPPPESSKYYYDDKAGAGTFAYILDSGIRTTHEEFEGRAKAAHSIYPADQTIHGDHGTGVAGIIGSKTYGVAKKATLISIHLLGPDGCTGSEAINALLWAAEDILKNSRKDSSVINLSFGIPKLKALNTFVERLITDTDIPIVVAAGNEADDASNHSPGSADGVISVGHINQQWAISETSNFGSAVSILAPGVGVETTGAGSDTNIIRETGSSFATPYISGLILNAISIHGIKGAANLKRHILETATKDKACIPPEKEDKKNRTPNLVGNNNNAEQDKEKQKDEPSSSRMFCCNGLLSKLACGRNRPTNV